MVEVTPSVLTLKNYKEAEVLVGLVRRVHVDVMDGKFVAASTLKKFEPVKVRAWKAFEKDVHLMVEKPEKFVAKYAKGARLVWFHVEATKKPLELIREIRKRGLLAGIAVNPETSEEKFAHLLNYVDSVLIMTVRPGKGGQEFISKMLDKIRLVRSVYSGEICVDGGVNPATAKKSVAAGANCVVAGAFLFNTGNAINNTKKLLRI